MLRTCAIWPAEATKGLRLCQLCALFAHAVVAWKALQNAAARGCEGRDVPELDSASRTGFHKSPKHVCCISGCCVPNCRNPLWFGTFLAMPIRTLKDNFSVNSNRGFCLPRRDALSQTANTLTSFYVCKHGVSDALLHCML